jgi:hypothetical protein
MGIIEKLQAEIQALKERVTALEQIEKKRIYDEAYNDYLNGDLDEIIENAVKEARKDVRQLTRDDIIEMAKRDVAELSWEDGDGRYYVVRVFKCNVEFVVNREKRTVVALLKWRANGKVYARGIAKCHPDDCFNAAIGRAIALRRALGLEVPDEYLNAPQPTEIRVGDIIRWEHVDCDYQVISLENKFPNVIGINRDGSRFEACGGNFYHHGMKIIDDTREEV